VSTQAKRISSTGSSATIPNATVPLGVSTPRKFQVPTVLPKNDSV